MYGLPAGSYNIWVVARNSFAASAESNTVVLDGWMPRVSIDGISGEVSLRLHENLTTNDPGAPTGTEGLGGNWYDPSGEYGTIPDDPDPHWEARGVGIVTEEGAPRIVDFEFDGVGGLVQTNTDTQSYNFDVAGTPGQRVQTDSAKPEITDFEVTGTTTGTGTTGGESAEWDLGFTGSSDAHNPGTPQEFYIHVTGSSATQTGIANGYQFGDFPETEFSGDLPLFQFVHQEEQGVERGSILFRFPKDPNDPLRQVADDFFTTTTGLAVPADEGSAGFSSAGGTSLGPIQVVFGDRSVRIVLDTLPLGDPAFITYSRINPNYDQVGMHGTVTNTEAINYPTITNNHGSDINNVALTTDDTTPVPAIPDDELVPASVRIFIPSEDIDEIFTFDRGLVGSSALRNDLLAKLQNSLVITNEFTPSAQNSFRTNRYY